MARGNTRGIKRHILNMLENIYDIKSYDFVNQEILDIAAKVTSEYNREVLVAISRQGNVLSVSVGTFDTGAISVNNQRKGLNGIRLIHTHPNGDSRLSQADLSALKRQRFDCVAALGISPQGEITDYHIGYLTANGVRVFKTQNINDAQYLDYIKQFDKELKAQKDYYFVENKPQKERVILACIAASDQEAEINLRELKSLALSAGAEVAAVFSQKKDKPDPKFMLGKGKIQEIKIAIQNYNADTLIIDNELSAIMIKNLEKELNVKVIDRFNLILDIFAARAQSAEGKLQVELAQLKYSLPKLLNTGIKMDRLRQGIGMRGPGEKKLETDRRRIKARIKDLEARLQKLKKERDLRRAKRAKSAIPTVALVGYTNAGKSTIMNLLSGANVLAEDKLFATLDPVTRKVYTPNGYYTLTDTVGFIRNLPHEFIDAFKSTLEEAVQADLILHVMDYSDPNLFSQYEAVIDVLAKIGAAYKPVINIYNKIDIAEDRLDIPATSNSVFISALTGQGVANLKALISNKLFGKN
ncbi:MAG: GTPase HflX [Clostridiales bacterium]|nr:GTPase HflX [Clostridiales bacterium]